MLTDALKVIRDNFPLVTEVKSDGADVLTSAFDVIDFIAVNVVAFAGLFVEGDKEYSNGYRGYRGGDSNYRGGVFLAA